MTDDREAERQALKGLGQSMRRARFADQLPEEERRRITLILTPTGVEVESDSGESGEEAEEAGGGME